MARNFRLSVLSVVVCLSCAMSVIGAQRTFVSAASGSDSNTCLRLSPCRNFAAAINAADDGGEVIVLDSGGYGAVTIAKAVSIIAPKGIYAGITAFSGNAIDISAGGGARVMIRGISINALGGDNGIVSQLDPKLYVDDVVVTNFNSYGIDLVGGTRASIQHTDVRGCGFGGVLLAGSTGSPVVVTADDIHLDDNNIGLAAIAGASVTVRNAVASRNSNSGFYFASGNNQQSVRVTVENSTAQDSVSLVVGGSKSEGFVADHGAHVTIRDSAAVRNDVGFVALNGAGDTTEMTVDRCLAAENAEGFIAGLPLGYGNGDSTAILDISNSNATRNSINGIRTGVGGIVHAFGNSVTRNGIGFNGGAGTFVSFGHNMVKGNTTETVPTIVNEPTM